MNCYSHINEEAKYICDKCRMPICEECMQVVGGHRICKPCVEQALFKGKDKLQKRDRINGFFFFILACIPGAAHMSLGLLKRGFQLMMGFIAIFPIGAYIYMESLIPVLVIPIWFFSMFDAYEMRRRYREDVPVEDSEVIDYGFIIKYKKYVGVGILVAGLLGFTNALQFSHLYEFLGIDTRQLYYSISRSIIPLLLMLLGFMIISRSRKSQIEAAESENDF
ncbi:MAG: hypothetical protein ACOZCL_10035 [Bacillota bacterium]